MSQSDYLKRRVTSHILNRQKTEKDELKPVLSSDEYTSFKRYQITNTVMKLIIKILFNKANILYLILKLTYLHVLNLNFVKILILEIIELI